LNIRQGEIVTMIGPSGAGKTTLLWAINWLNAPDEGQIEFNGAAIDAKTATKKQISGLRGKSAMVFQHYNLFRNKTALENVTQSLLCVKKMNKQDAVLRGRQLLDRVGLPTGALARMLETLQDPLLLSTRILTRFRLQRPASLRTALKTRGVCMPADMIFTPPPY